MDTSSFVLPCCSSCQTMVTASFEFKSLADQQAQLAEQINKNTEVIHRSIQPNSLGVIDEAIDRLEALVTDVKNQLATAKSSCFAGNVNAVKNHITAMFDVALESSKSSISTAVQSIANNITDEVKGLSKDVRELASLTLDITSLEPMRNNPLLEIDILNELKAISANIMTNSSTEVESLDPTLDSPPSLNAELNAKKEDNSGWRLLGTRKVWKANWEEYDKRQLRRLDQQKQAEKARRRRKRNATRNSTTSRNSRLENNVNNDCNNNYTNAPRRTVFGSRRYDNDNSNKSNMNANYLPPDRELLAAAKNQFSRPPSNYRPTIRFEKRETLNPYQPDGLTNPQHIMTQRSPPSPPCEACACKHSCFRRT